MKKRWKVANDKVPQSVDDVIEILIENRKLDPGSVNETLAVMEKYLQIRNLDAAAKLMADHILKGSRIVLVGDYDCDGVTSTAQVSLFLQQIGHRDWSVVIPSRSEGYGVPLRAVQENPEARLFLTMDCGTLDAVAISAARKLGADVIVIDHHEVPEDPKKVAPATSLVNPKQPGCPSLFKEFCASGLTLLFLSRLRKFLSATFGQIPINGRYLALSAIGTVADMVSLTHGNRLLVKAGLDSINKPEFDYEPIIQLRKVSRLDQQPLSAGHIGFCLGPLVNAMGRMGDPMTAYKLLATSDRGTCARLASELNDANSRRQLATERVLTSIRQRVESGEWAGRRTLVAGNVAWPQGVIGICASKVIESIHYGPTILFEIDKDAGIAKGSARSISGFDIYDALTRCDDLLVRWGGHRMAAGLTISLDKFDAFMERFESVALNCDPDVFRPLVRIDCELPQSLVGKPLYDALEALQPHGMGNSTPAFLMKDVRAEVKRVFGQDKQHLSLDIDGIPAVWWSAGDTYGLKAGEAIRTDLVVELNWDAYHNDVQLRTREAAF